MLTVIRHPKNPEPDVFSRNKRQKSVQKYRWQISNDQAFSEIGTVNYFLISSATDWP